MVTEDTVCKQNHTLGAVAKHPCHALQKTLSHTHTENVVRLHTRTPSHTKKKITHTHPSVSEALKDKYSGLLDAVTYYLHIHVYSDFGKESIPGQQSNLLFALA